MREFLYDKIERIKQALEKEDNILIRAILKDKLEEIEDILGDDYEQSVY